jgi:hypothetical protein
MTLATFLWIVGGLTTLIFLLFAIIVLYALHNYSERELVQDRINALEAERVQGDKAGLYLCEDCGWSGDELVNVFCCQKCEAVPTLNPNSKSFKAAYIGANKIHEPEAV